MFSIMYFPSLDVVSWTEFQSEGEKNPPTATLQLTFNFWSRTFQIIFRELRSFRVTVKCDKTQER